MFQKFRKVGPIFFSKKYFLRKLFIGFPNKNIFQPTFSREKKSRNVDIFAIFSLENVRRKKCSENSHQLCGSGEVFKHTNTPEMSCLGRDMILVYF